LVSATVRYQVRQAQGRRELEQALTLRYEVFCVEQAVPRHEELDGRDADGIHLVAVEEPDDVGGVLFGEAGCRADAEPTELLATCRLLLVGRTIQFSRLAVRADARRRGIATTMLEVADAESRTAGARRIVLHAQTYARSLYENAGYRPRGGVFREAGIEHIAMEKEL
jgi:predicted GNAT family N-acyltransferase